MQHQPTAGARVRVTKDDTVHHVLPDGTVALTSGRLIAPGEPDIHIAILEPGYRPGDTVHDGTQQLFRVTPSDAPAYWITAHGHVFQDRDIDPTQFRIVRTATAAEQDGEAQQ